MGQKKARIGLLSDTERYVVEDYKNLKKLRNQRNRLKGTSPSHPEIKELTQKINKISKRYSTLSRDIRDRIESVHDDLRIILDNEELVRDLKLLEMSSFLGIVTKLERLKTPTFQDVSENADLSDYSTWRIHVTKENGKRKYSLSTTEEKKPTARDTFSAYYPIRGIKGIYSTKMMIEKRGKLIEVPKIMNVKKILFEALDLMKKFPESNIINQPYTIKEIWYRIEKFKKKQLEKSQPKIEKISFAEIPVEERGDIVYIPTRPKKKESENERMQHVQKQREELRENF